MIVYGGNGLIYQLGAKLQEGEGAEGYIYEVQANPDKVAKKFKRINKNLEDKIDALIHLPWSADCRKYLVLPEVAIYEDFSRTIFIGYLMEKIDASSKLIDVYMDSHPLSIYQKVCVAENLCKAIKAVHEQTGLVLGDFNAKNVMVSRETGDVKIIDVDSVHLTVNKISRGRRITRTFRCEALYPSLFMPEIINKFIEQKVNVISSISGETFNRYTDYYCLAFHIHWLLLTVPPFGLVPKNELLVDSKPAPPPRLLASKGMYAYTNLPNRYRTPDFFPSFDVISPQLQLLFIRAFVDGANDPSARPTATEFLDALEEYAGELQFNKCSGFDHFLRKGHHFLECEWCRVEREKHQKRELYLEEIEWMTNEQLYHLLNKFSKYKCATYLELGRRYGGIHKRGLKQNDRLAAKSYKLCISSKKNEKDKLFVTQATKELEELRRNKGFFFRLFN